MKKIENIWKTIDKPISYLAGFCIAAMLICVFLQVVARTFRFSINWTTEMSQYFFLWSTTFGCYIIARNGKLLGVEIVRKLFPLPIQRALKFISYMFASAFYFIAIYFCILRMPSLMRQTTPVLKWSIGIIYIIMLIGLAILTLYFVYLAILGLVGADEKKSDKPKTAEQIAEEVE